MTDDASKPPPPRGLKRRFLAGFVIGAAATILAPAAGIALLAGGVLAYDRFVGHSRERAPIDQFLTTRGGDISAAGGTRVVAELDGHVFRQDCREACDDVETEFGAARRVRVLATDGQCILCEDEGPWSAIRPDTHWVVVGAPSLRIERRPLR